MIRPRILGLLLCMGFTAATASEIHRSIGAGGVVSFSNLPPDGDVQLPNRGAPAAAALRRDPAGEEKLRAQDAAVQRANALLDQAERALAVARRNLQSVGAAAGYAAPHPAQGERQRVDFYKREVLAAQRLLLEALKHMRRAREELTPSFETPAVHP